MEILTFGLKFLFGDGPLNFFGFLVTITVVLIAGMIYLRKNTFTEFTSVSATQQEMITSLVSQIKTLSEELHTTRAELKKLHELNIELMEEVRASKLQIMALEFILSGKGGPDGQ